MIGTKGAYAQHRGVTPGRVSQWLASGWLDEALVDAGGHALPRTDRQARIDFERADGMLRQRLHIGQVLGQGRPLPPPNGDTPATDAAPLATEPEFPRTAFVPVDDAARLQRAKVVQAEINAERERRKAQEERGLYMLTAAARAEFGRRLSDLVAAVEAWLPDLATATVARTVEGGAVDRKELQVLFRDQWRQFRAQQARRAATAGETLDPFIQAEGAPPS